MLGHERLLCSPLLLFLQLLRVFGVEEDDRIYSLPNTTFKVNFNQFSGYIHANKNGSDKLFYWLTEAISNPDSAPLLIWLNGGPGCSSISGLLGEYGPFYITKEGNALVKNIHAWNREFNVLYLESPIGVGFSYQDSDPMKFSIGDDETAALNYQALRDFFLRVQPKFIARKWFLTGESYAGIYIPTVTNLILNSIGEGKFPNPKFQGIAIGNGYINQKNLTNSLIHWHVYHGAIGFREWSDIKHTCCEDVKVVEHCDFHQHVKENSTMTVALDRCGQLFIDALNVPSNQNEYNYYQDCYKGHHHVRPTQRGAKINPMLFTHLINHDTTDNQFGFPCWNEEAMNVYMNKVEVQKALHVDKGWTKNEDTEWVSCNDDMTDEYKPKYLDTFELFQDIIKKVEKFKKKLPRNFRILFFNGDVDTVCNFIGVSWHVDNIAHHGNFTPSRRQPWKFRNQVAGYVQRYRRQLASKNSVIMDVLTVKGAGHFVSDRPGPALQMITNFIKGSANYSNGGIVKDINFNSTKIVRSNFGFQKITVTLILFLFLRM